LTFSPPSDLGQTSARKSDEYWSKSKFRKQKKYSKRRNKPKAENRKRKPESKQKVKDSNQKKPNRFWRRLNQIIR